MRSLRARLLIIVSIALVPALAFQLYSELDARQARAELAQQSALRLVRMVAAEQDRVVEGARQLLTAVATAPAVQSRDPRICNEYLQAVQAQFDRYVSIAAIGLDGHIYCGSRSTDPGIGVSDRTYFRLAVQTGGFVLGEYAVGRSSREPSLHLASALRDDNGKVTGVVYAALSLGWLRQQLEALPLPPGTVAWVADRTGTILARQPEGVRFSGQRVPDWLRSTLSDSQITVREIVKAHGQTVVVATNPIDAAPTGLMAAVSLNRDQLLGSVVQSDRQALLLLFAGAALAIALTAIAARRLIRAPLDRLLDSAARWEAGDLTVRTGLSDGGPEFGRLSAAFDAMAEAVGARERELRRLNQELEERVRGEVLARQAAQERAAHAERLQALGQLAGGIAHDFNNVLQTVQGAANLLQGRARDTNEVRRMAGVIAEASERGSAITGRLLAFARRGDLRAEPIAIEALLQQLREILNPALGSPVTVQIECARDLPLLMADKAQLETVLVNLATNARDAMPQGGTLVLSAVAENVRRGVRHPAGLRPGRYVRLSVADNGTGMNSAILSRAIEPFFTTKPLGKGTGLGLAMAKGFAEQSGGDLAIASLTGRGTTVELWLPQAPDTARVEPALPRAPKPLVVARAIPALRRQSDRPARILLVDDETAVRETLREQLEELGFSVVPAASGDDALDLLDRGTPVDVLVTDLSMPGMTGSAVIEAVHARLPDLPALLLTGHAADLDEHKLDRGVEVIHKPIGGRALAGHISALLAETQPA